MNRLASGHAAGSMQPTVVFAGRGSKPGKALDWMCLGLFLIAVAAHVGTGVWMATEENFDLSTGPSDEILLEQLVCVSGRRALGSMEELFIDHGPYERGLADAVACQDLFCLFGESIVPVVFSILLAPAAGLAWFVGMYFLPQQLTWATVVFNVVMYLLVGIAILLEDLETAVGITFCVWSLILAVIVYVTRKSISQAAEHLGAAVGALSKNKDIFLATGVWEIIMLAYMGMTFYFFTVSARIIEVDPSNCGFTRSDRADKMAKFHLFVLLWVIAYVNAAKLVIVAMSIGSYLFNEQPSGASLSALKTTLTTSAPTLAFGSLIVAVVEFILEKINSRFWWLDPVGCLLKLIYLCFASCISALTRFSFVVHAFTGDSFNNSAKGAYHVLKTCFVNAYVTDRVAVTVVRTASNFLAISIGLVVWAWIDNLHDFNTLSDVVDLFGGLFGALAFILAYLYLTYRPIMSILLITLINNEIAGWFTVTGESFVPLASLFVACIAAIILQFQGSLLLAAVDTVFIAHAINRSNGTQADTSDGREFMYKIMADVEEDNKGNIPVAYPVVVASVA